MNVHYTRREANTYTGKIKDGYIIENVRKNKGCKENLERIFC